MLFLFFSRFTTSTNLEILDIAGRRLRLHVDAVHASGGRSAADLPLDAIDRFLVALRQHFHTSIRQVADPPAHPFTPRRFVGKKPEPDAMHAAGHQNSSRDQHQDSIEKTDNSKFTIYNLQFT